jgi:activator of 2-hydroxyglutaryl-CoA dehydratase
VKTILGVDIGSVAVKLVLMRDGEILHALSHRLNASLADSLVLSLQEMEAVAGTPDGWVLTGRGAAALATSLGIDPGQRDPGPGSRRPAISSRNAAP